ncbi:helix-turn-helix domain-containing protein [Streptomyces sp. NPDC006197]|uniref:helix-turn-helix domain-containing protein n=1 Tax=Streptomyces sp. NPDC006197 TaxID=3156685 RepID=UPI0033B781CB
MPGTPEGARAAVGTRPSGRRARRAARGNAAPPSGPSGKTLAVLAGEVGYSKSQVRSLLGGRIPPRLFVVRMVAATVPPLLRERREAEALKLLRDALHPPRTEPSTHPRRPD